MVNSAKKYNKISKKSNKSRKNSRSHTNKNKRKSKSSNMQKGGVSTACVLPYAVGGKANLNHTDYSSANMHNLNPQASFDFDKSFMKGGVPVPLGQMGGGSKCGDEGVGTSHSKSETFKEYINTLDKKLSFEGGGYTVNPEKYIAGNPVIDGYDDNNPPAIIGGKLVMVGAQRQVCGNGATRSRSKRSKNSKRSKKSKKSRKLQKGGDFVTIGSKPALYSTAFDGPPGVFKYPDDMMSRDFAAKQPNYGVNAI